MKYWNPSQERWQATPYGVKEHSVHDGPYIATVVIVPPQTSKKEVEGEEDKGPGRFIMSGVRIEDVRWRDKIPEGFGLPGHLYFAKMAKNKPVMISETPCWQWHTHFNGVYMHGGYPEIRKPHKPGKGSTSVPLEGHPAQKLFESLINRALESYEMYKEACRAA